MNESVSNINEIKKVKIIIIGNPNVGKTCILNRYNKDEFNGENEPTIGIDFIIKKIFIGEVLYKIHFWDTAGQEKFRALIPSYIKDSKAVIMVYDITNKNSFVKINDWYNDIIENNKELIIGLLGNKKDLNDERVVTIEEGNKKAQELNVLFQEVSAKTGENIQDFFKNLIDIFLDKEDINKNENQEDNGGIIKPEEFENPKNPKKNKKCC